MLESGSAGRNDKLDVNLQLMALLGGHANFSDDEPGSFYSPRTSGF